jgi:hypothetical protein
MNAIETARRDLEQRLAIVAHALVAEFQQKTGCAVLGLSARVTNDQERFGAPALQAIKFQSRIEIDAEDEAREALET